MDRFSHLLFNGGRHFPAGLFRAAAGDAVALADCPHALKCYLKINNLVNSLRLAPRLFYLSLFGVKNFAREKFRCFFDIFRDSYFVRLKC